MKASNISISILNILAVSFNIFLWCLCDNSLAGLIEVNVFNNKRDLEVLESTLISIT